MTQIDLEDWLISSAGAIPASRCHKPESASAIKMTDISGRKCLGLSKQCGRAGLLEKMLLGTSLWASTTCYLIWKPQATPAGALLFRLSPSMPRTDATDAGLWPTPDASDRGPRSADLVMNRSTVQRRDSGQKRGIDLQTVVGGPVNPELVEWLMGYPVGYTACDS